jgi:hypothetical protein
MPKNVTKWNVTVPVGTDNADGDDQLIPMVTNLDTHAKDLTQGTLASRPAASTYGRYYFATDTGVLFRDDGIKWNMVSTPMKQEGGSSLPTLPNPTDHGMIVDYVADSPNGVMWRFRYNASSGSSYKWEYIGSGQFLWNETDQALHSITSTSYVSLPGGPSITIPLAGEYDLEYGGSLYLDTSYGVASMTWSAAGVSGSASDEDACYHDCYDPSGFNAINTVRAYGSRQIRRIFPAGASVQLVYRVFQGGAHGWFYDRWIRATPVRVS